MPSAGHGNAFFLLEVPAGDISGESASLYEEVTVSVKVPTVAAPIVDPLIEVLPPESLSYVSYRFLAEERYISLRLSNLD